MYTKKKKKRLSEIQISEVWRSSLSFWMQDTDQFLIRTMQSCIRNIITNFLIIIIWIFCVKKLYPFIYKKKILTVQNHVLNNIIQDEIILWVNNISLCQKIIKVFFDLIFKNRIKLGILLLSYYLWLIAY